MRSLVATLALIPSFAFAQPAPALPKANPCPYTAAQVSAALGVKVAEGRPSEMPFPGGVEYSCTFEQQGGFMAFYVQQMVMSVADQQKGDAYWQQTLAGKSTAIAGDPDGARWQLDPYNAKTLALHYLRGTHRVTLRVVSAPAQAEAMKPKLLALKRLP
jgi:hypothetical protein